MTVNKKLKVHKKSDRGGGDDDQQQQQKSHRKSTGNWRLEKNNNQDQRVVVQPSGPLLPPVDDMVGTVCGVGQQQYPTAPIVGEKDPRNNGYNSEDEYLDQTESVKSILQNWTDRDEKFMKLMAERLFDVVAVSEDGACLFRAISLQLYGTEGRHDEIRQKTMDYIEANRGYFSQFVTEDIDKYVSRKRNQHTHGNHIEIQAMSEIYNRPIEVYCYETTPINIFNSTDLDTKNCAEPLRVSYQRDSHYNAILDRNVKAPIEQALHVDEQTTAPVVVESTLRKQREHYEIEQAMLEDKIKTSDWEATNQELEEQIARESYLQWQRDARQSSKCKRTERTATSTFREATASPGASCSGYYPVEYGPAVDESVTVGGQQKRRRIKKNGTKRTVAGEQTAGSTTPGDFTTSSEEEQSSDFYESLLQSTIGEETEEDAMRKALHMSCIEYLNKFN